MLDSFQPEMTAAVVGASGGIGLALIEALNRSERVACVHALSRKPVSGGAKVMWTHFDFDELETLEAAAQRIGTGRPLDLVIVASGLLHGEGVAPEKDWRQLDPAVMARVFHVNAIGPAIAARTLLPLMRREGRSVFAALSARVGSISDNRLGGWYSYRASKAALNMIMKNIAIELERKRLATLAVALHPGTVDTTLSQPFQTNTRPGQVVSTSTAAANLLTAIDGLRAQDNGRLIAWDQELIGF